MTKEEYLDCHGDDILREQYESSHYGECDVCGKEVLLYDLIETEDGAKVCGGCVVRCSNCNTAWSCFDYIFSCGDDCEYCCDKCYDCSND